MPLETATHINDLIETNPVGTDSRIQGDDHLRQLKRVLKTDLPMPAPASVSGLAVLMGTPAASRTALGATTTGDAVYIAATPAAARAAMDVPSFAEMRGNTFVNVFSFMTAAEIADVKGASVLNHTAAITAAIASMTKGVLLYPAGKYNVTGNITTTAHGLTHLGEGQEATQIFQQSTTADTFIFNSTQFSGVRGMKISNATTPTAGWAVRFLKTGAVGCFFGFAKDLLIQDAFNGVDINASAETRVSKLHMRRLGGTRGVQFRGTGSGVNGSYRAVLEDCVGDTAGNGNTSMIWYNQDSYAYSLVVNKCTGLYGGKLFTMTDSANTGTSFPMWCYAWDFEGDHNYSNSIELLAGEGFNMEGSWIGSCETGSGIFIGGSYRGEVDVSTTRIMGNWQHGVIISAGPVEVSVHNCNIGANSQQTSGSFHGIVVSANTTRFHLRDNRCGSLASGGVSQGYGIFVLAGASTNYHITNNGVSGNVTGGVLNAAPHATGIDTGNV